MLVWPALFLVWMNKGAVPQGLSGRRPYWVVMVGAVMTLASAALKVCVASANNPWSLYRYRVRWAGAKGSPVLLAYCSFQMRRSWGS